MYPNRKVLVASRRVRVTFANIHHLAGEYSQLNIEAIASSKLSSSFNTPRTRLSHRQFQCLQFAIACEQSGFLIIPRIIIIYLWVSNPNPLHPCCKHSREDIVRRMCPC